MQVIEVYKAYYMDEVNKLPADLRSFLYDDIVSDKYFLVFDMRGVVGGFTVRYDGELSGLFARRRGYGERIFKIRLEYAKKYAKKPLYIFCIGEHLRDLYQKFGFKVDNVIKWDDNQAPAKWNYDRFGRPDLYEMSLK